MTLPATSVPQEEPTLESHAGPGITDDGLEPTEWELTHLRRVGESISPAIFLVAIAETAERFVYRCMTGPLRMFAAGGARLY